MLVTTSTESPDAWEVATGRADPPGARSLGRWVAVDGGVAVGAVEIRVRPDDRAFLAIHGSDDAAVRHLIEAALRSVERPVHVVSRVGQVPGRAALLEMGFEVVLSEDIFRIAFVDALDAVDRAWVPSGTSIVSASDLDLDRLFDLDNALRQLVPGTDGWVGDRSLFSEEFSETPPFEPGTYLVGVDDRSDALLGLIRIWRNPSGPRLGLVAVLPTHRSTTLGPVLIKHGLRAAAAWGWTHFETETSRSNRHLHHRLVELGAERTGSLEILRR